MKHARKERKLGGKNFVWQRWALEQLRHWCTNNRVNLHTKHGCDIYILSPDTEKVPFVDNQRTPTQKVLFLGSQRVIETFTV